MRRIAHAALVYAASLAVLGLFLAPILWLVALSFKLRRDIFAWPPTILDFTPTLANYAAVLSASGRYLTYLTNSVIVAAISTLVAMVVGVLGAYGLSGRRRPRSAAWSYWMLSFRMMPPVALVIPYYVLFQSLGLLGRLGTVALTHSVFSVAVVLWMTKSFFDEVPREIEEAAIVDGATTGQVFRLVMLPTAKAALAASAIFAFLTSWNEFLFAVIFARSTTYTVPVAISTFVGEVYVSWGELAAATVLGILPALLVAFLGQRHLLVGLAPGAVK